ncbi:MULTISPECIES: hypothetical protein [Azospirillum]|uniref:hypothetical protein n=1 Tax=Azospirillum TaxID=191 RepID=UPI001178A052|nr:MULTISPECIES: hypothetical protein [Azospirillum]
MDSPLRLQRCLTAQKMLSYSYSETNLVGNQFPGKMAFAHLRFSKGGKLVSFQTNEMNTRQPNQRIVY